MHSRERGKGATQQRSPEVEPYVFLQPLPGCCRDAGGSLNAPGLSSHRSPAGMQRVQPAIPGAPRACWAAAPIVTLCFTFHSILCTTREQEGTGDKHKALRCSLLKLWDEEKESCHKVVEMLHSHVAFVLNVQKRVESRQGRSWHIHPPSVMLCCSLDLHCQAVPLPMCGL